MVRLRSDCISEMWSLLIVVSSASVCRGLNVNDTFFNSIPPLYALDDWTQCQRPGDVYCTVDAVLKVAEPKSSLLSLLQEYSSQTLKHYNRTQIHRGVCVSRCRREQPADTSWNSVQNCVNQSVLKYGLQAELLSMDWCVSQDAKPVSGSARALAVFCTTLVAIACLATVLHVLAERCVKVDGNKYLMAFSLKRNLDVLIRNRCGPKTQPRLKDVASIEGIRFFGMQCVIFSNVLIFYVYSYTDNPEFIEKLYDQFPWQMIVNSPLWVQAFFSISGFLTAYTVLLSSEKRSLTIFSCLQSVLNRWIRLTPMALFALWFTIAWFPMLGSGPQWAWLVEREAQDCSERWWYHILYIQNFLPSGKFCMGHTWYLAAAMQLHVLGMILLVILMKYRSATALVLMIFMAGPAAATGFVVYWHDLMPIATAYSPELIRTIFAGSEILSLVLLPFWMNLPGYIGGVAVAFLLYHNQTSGNKLARNMSFNVIFHAALFVGLGVTLGGRVFLRTAWPPWAAALYAALDRTLVAVCFNLFLLGCFSRCKSLVRDALEWRGFHALGRLSYCVFLVHFTVLRLTMAENTHVGHISVFSLLSLFITTSVLSYAVSVPLCLLVELPGLQLWNAIASDQTREIPAAETPTRRPDKPCDLVSQVRRRHEYC
ncbi:nose resistant to fluoxetine protein 6 [Bombyx mori]|uniref:Acyltransferase 3 domain-containing protein n=1 Tax=Bombyx mori TaxID=7091 RepID=A0A8R2M3I5_BOMMO|nr:nose resistant to fluoxetine protein 6 [Bombyx mori]